jgi:hypothetical protein
MKMATLNNEVQFASEGANIGGVPCGVLWAAIRIFIIF